MRKFWDRWRALSGGLILAGLASAQVSASAPEVTTQEKEAAMVKAGTSSSARQGTGSPQGERGAATREALLRDLREGDQLRQMAASQALAAYASEPEVREALVQALEKSSNDVVRANAAKALAGEFKADGAVAELLLQALRQDASELVRMTVAQELKEHTDDARVRRAMLDALNGDTSDGVRMSASQALIPFAAEPEVHRAFVAALRGGNEIVRANAVRALTETTPPEQSIRGELLSMLSAGRSSFERMNAARALGRYLDSPEVVGALVRALKTEKDEGVRMSASAALAGAVGSEEVYSLMLDLARSDNSKLVRANALDALSTRIRERQELRGLFLGYLDDSSVLLQYHALKGLVELGDASLRPRLVEKARAIINAQLGARQDRRVILDTLGLLKRLDPAEADRMLERLSREGVREEP